MAPIFHKVNGILPNTAIIEVVRDDGRSLNLVAVNTVGTTGVSIAEYENHSIISAVSHDVTPEQYLVALANFLGYTVTPSSIYNPNATTEELLPIIMKFADHDGCLRRDWIKALKAVREYTGWGLKAAKDAVDPYRVYDR